MKETNGRRKQSVPGPEEKATTGSPIRDRRKPHPPLFNKFEADDKEVERLKAHHDLMRRAHLEPENEEPSPAQSSKRSSIEVNSLSQSQNTENSLQVVSQTESRPAPSIPRPAQEGATLESVSSQPEEEGSTAAAARLKSLQCILESDEMASSNPASNQPNTVGLMVGQVTTDTGCPAASDEHYLETRVQTTTAAAQSLTPKRSTSKSLHSEHDGQTRLHRSPANEYASLAYGEGARSVHVYLQQSRVLALERYYHTIGHKGKIDAREVLASFAGREELLFSRLALKYGKRFEDPGSAIEESMQGMEGESAGPLQRGRNRNRHKERETMFTITTSRPARVSTKGKNMLQLLDTASSKECLSTLCLLQK